MRRREFITLIGGATTVWPFAALAQQQTSRVRRVGVLIPYSRVDKDSQIQYSAFISALHQLGWTNGQNLEIDALWTNGDESRIAQLAKELVAREPAVILARATPVTTALRKETRTIPIAISIGERQAMSIAFFAAKTQANFRFRPRPSLSLLSISRLPKRLG